MIVSRSNVSKPLVTACEILVASTLCLGAISDPELQNVRTRFSTSCLKRSLISSCEFQVIRSRFLLVRAAELQRTTDSRLNFTVCFGAKI